MPNGKKMKIGMTSAEAPEIPVLTNPSALEPKTRLVALDDMVLNGIRVKQQQEKAKEAEAAVVEQKKKEKQAKNTT